MLEALKEILLDNQQRGPFTGTRRASRLESVTGKANICIGVRRCGKSTFMHQIIAGLEQAGVARENIAHVNFVDDRLHLLHATGIGAVTEAYYSLYPEKKQTQTVYFFFDEIQAIPEWEVFVERLMRTETCEVYITGSSAQMLSREIATQMRGRSLSWEMFPFSFGEFLAHKGIDATAPFSSKSRMTVQKAFEAFWKSGGFPEVLDSSDRIRVKIHQEYFQTILYRDIVERHDISHPKALRDLAYKLLDNAASLYSINSLYGHLKSVAHNIQKSSVGQNLEWLEDSYFLFSVRLYDASISKSNANPKKIYCIDHALVTSISSGILVNAGHLLENLVFTALRRKSASIFYYRSKSGKEVDFLAIQDRREKRMVQVCESLADGKTRKRELSALWEAMAELQLTEAILVTRNESETIETPTGRVQILPAWKFLLEQEA